MTCERCQTVPTFPDEGVWLCYPASDMVYLGFVDALKDWRTRLVEGESGQLKLFYAKGELPKLATQLINQLDPYALKSSRIGCFQSEASWSGFGLMSAYEFAERATHGELLNLIQNKAFRHAMQPIVAFETGKVYGYEFLIRPLQGAQPFSPAELFAFSQRAGLQSTLDSASRMRAIESGAKLVPEGMNRFINFLPSSIYDPRHCLKSTMQVASDNQVDSRDLIFEVVETERIEDLYHLKHILNYYKEQGMRVALDDIGTGYATLDLLKNLRPDFAKMDRSLIQDCDQSEEKIDKLKAVIDLAKELNITVIAEGIEREEEYRMCRDLGADLAQGYFLGRPADTLWEPTQEFQSFLL